MSFKSTFGAAVAATLFFGPVLAGDISVDDAYMRSATKTSPTGAAFMMLMNAGDEDDRLVAAQSDVAERVELHTHIEDENGVMRMREVEGGIVVPAGGMHALKRGGDHVMFMGLTRPLNDGDTVSVTLSFEKAGEMVVEVPVDLTRKPDHGAMQHSHDNDS